MRRPPLLYFSSVFWDDPFITPQQVALGLARYHDVLFVNPSPSYLYLRAPGRNHRWVRFGRQPFEVAPGLHVYSPPPVLPLKTRFQSFNTISQGWIRPFVRRALAWLDLDRPILFTFVPHTYAAVGRYGERLVCYYCIDDMGTLSRATNPAVVARYEHSLLGNADLILTTAVGLHARLSRSHPSVYVVPNGTNPEVYARALSPDTPVAPEIAGLPKPVLGFSGVIDSRLDQGLLAEVAHLRPDWSIALVGPVRTSVASLRRLPNVYFVPPQPLERLPSCLKGFGVALIPYVLNSKTACIHPTKLNDYLAAGLPVVSTRLPELVRDGANIVNLASGAAEFIAAAEQILLRRSPDEVLRRVAFARENSWERRADAIAEHLQRHLDEREACGS